jgi:hypothetical protein
MENNYFKDCTTENATRKLYVSLAKILHPDIGGSKEQFQELQNQYEAKLKSLHGTYNTKEDAAEGKRKYEYDPAIERDLMNMLFAVQGVRLPDTMEISLQGTWIWVKGVRANERGNYPIEQRFVKQLENLGFKYHTMKGECYYRDPKNRCSNKGKIMKFDRINRKYRGAFYSNIGAEQIN